MTSGARADQWLAAAAATPEKFQRPGADVETKVVSAEIQSQVKMDMARTYSKMLFGYQAPEEKVAERRQQVTDLMIQWLSKEETLTYMQGMNHVMATCFREVGDENGAVQVFDCMIRKADEALFHSDVSKLIAANQGLAEKLHEMIREKSPKVAERLAEGDIDYMPMIVQNWLIDIFLHVLPTEAAARLWDHVLESEGVALKFAVQLLLSGKQAILSCREEELQEVFSELPSRIERPEDVDMLLHLDLADKLAGVHVQPNLSDFNDFLADPLLGGNMPPMQLEIKRAVRMPRRWQPWKFVTVALVIPWLLMHATRVHQPVPTLSKQVAPPMLRKASLPPVFHFVPMHEANWPK